MSKLISNEQFPNINKFKKQVVISVNEGLIKPINPEQLFINIMALNMLPFIAAPLLKGFLTINNNNYQQLMEDRKTVVAEFIINAIKI